MTDFPAPAFFRVNDNDPIEMDSVLHVFQNGTEIVTVVPANFTAMPSRHVHLLTGDTVLVEFYHRGGCEVPARSEGASAPERRATPSRGKNENHS